MPASEGWLSAKRHELKEDEVFLQRCTDCGFLRYGKLLHIYHDDSGTHTGKCMADYEYLGVVWLSQIQIVLHDNLGFLDPRKD